MQQNELNEGWRKREKIESLMKREGDRWETESEVRERETGEM